MCSQSELYKGKSRLVESQARLVRELTRCIEVLSAGRVMARAEVPQHEQEAVKAAHEALAATCRLVKATGVEA